MAETGPLVRRLRRGAGYTQAELGERMGTTQSVISRWEHGHDEPRVSTLEKIARACGHRLILDAEPDGVDRAQIRQQLSLTPSERLASVVNIERMRHSARPVG